ncbi:MAG: hypothetical protein P8107_04605, partial [Spirochaetia bacterium]
MRIELCYKPEFGDGRSEKLLHSIQSFLHLRLRAITIVDVFLLNGIENLQESDYTEIFQDPVAQDLFIQKAACLIPRHTGWKYLVEICYKPGVTDPVALTARQAVKNWTGKPIPAGAVIENSVQYLIHCPTLSAEDIERLTGFLYNPLIQNCLVITDTQWQEGIRPPEIYEQKLPPGSAEVAFFDLEGMSDTQLEAFSKDRLLALTREEMQAVRNHFKGQRIKKARRSRGLPAQVSDVELEMVAQTWSEHCKHKIFNATIHYREKNKNETIRSLFKTYIK